ncbi:MAG: nicotinate-nucleotide adenylyltransferase [Verrucomicrobia bacterium]|nr:MAG: nicotinate-nucleotide adenylyltransferase [Verrucomicrobiota bacterium]
MPDEKLSTNQKAIQINREARRQGTFAEIGAGQEVARRFFRVGGAAGTVAKTISAYDMAVSDAIYGPAERYVSRRRLRAMLDHEYALLLERLGAKRENGATFFVFADTVATRKAEGNGWLGIKFQADRGAEPSEIFLHVRMLDKENERQQEALGVLGVNLIYGAFFSHHEPDALIRSLLDNLTWERIEVDMIRFAGPAFSGVDERLMALQLVKEGLTEAAMFTAQGEAIQWAEVLYKKPVLVQRGSFRPVTRATLDVLERSLEQFVQEPELKSQTPVVLMEMTLRHLATRAAVSPTAPPPPLGAPKRSEGGPTLSSDPIDPTDFLHRADTLQALGQTVLISNFARFHRLASYLSRYTQQPIGIAMGASHLQEIFDEALYNQSEGGLLGGLGQLFKNDNRLYVYPHLDLDSGQVITAENYPVPPHLRHLHQFLLESRCLRPVRDFNGDLLPTRRLDVLARMQSGDALWEQHVPPQIVEVIKRGKLFGYKA